MVSGAQPLITAERFAPSAQNLVWTGGRCTHFAAVYLFPGSHACPAGTPFAERSPIARNETLAARTLSRSSPQLARLLATSYNTIALPIDTTLVACAI